MVVDKKRGLEKNTVMYTNIKTSLKVECTISEPFDVKFGVSLLLFALVVEEVTKGIRERVVKEMLYADDLMLLGDYWKEVESRYTRWKKALLFKNKRMKINVNKTKVFCTNRNFV